MPDPVKPQGQPGVPSGPVEPSKGGNPANPGGADPNPSTQPAPPGSATTSVPKQAPGSDAKGPSAEQRPGDTKPSANPPAPPSANRVQSVLTPAAVAAAKDAIDKAAQQQSGPKAFDFTGSVGGPFAIYGDTLGEPAAFVTIGDRQVAVTNWRNGRIKGVIPRDMPSGNVTITVNGKSVQGRV